MGFELRQRHTGQNAVILLVLNLPRCLFSAVTILLCTVTRTDKKDRRPRRLLPGRPPNVVAMQW
jgi:hypothetical protein